MAFNSSMIELIAFLNTDKIFYACAMLSMNVGSRYVIQDMSHLQERILASTVAKRIVLFCMVFVATKDVILSLIITFVCVLVLQYLLNENSPFCIIPSVVIKPINDMTLNDLTRGRNKQQE